METLRESLGKFYFQAHNTSPPTFLQVVGWTKGAERPDIKRHYVYVRKVPVLITHSYGGGEWRLDHQLVAAFSAEIKEPIHKSTNPLVTGNAIVIPGAQFLRYQGETVPKFNP